MGKDSRQIIELLEESGTGDKRSLRSLSTLMGIYNYGDFTLFTPHHESLTRSWKLLVGGIRASILPELDTQYVHMIA